MEGKIIGCAFNMSVFDVGDQRVNYISIVFSTEIKVPQTQLHVFSVNAFSVLHDWFKKLTVKV